MGYLILAVLIGLGIAACFLVVVVLAVPWAEDNCKQQAYKLLGENSPDPNSLRDTIEGLSSCDDEEAKELTAHLTVKLVQEVRAIQDDQEHGKTDSTSVAF